MEPVGRSSGRKTLDARALDRLAGGLERVVPWAAWVVRPARLLAVGGLAAGLGLFWLAYRSAEPGSVIDWIGLVLLAALLVAPGVVLLLFVLFLGQLLDLPNQLRALPGTTRSQSARFATAMGTLRQPRTSGSRGMVGGLWQLRGAVMELAGLAEPFMGLAGLVRLPFLLLVLAAAVAVMVEIALFVLVGVLVAVF